MLQTGPVGFMGYGNLWGFNSIVLIFYKSRLGFMGISGLSNSHVRRPGLTKFMGIYGDLYHLGSAHKSQPGFIKNQYYQITSP